MLHFAVVQVQIANFGESAVIEKIPMGALSNSWRFSAKTARCGNVVANNDVALKPSSKSSSVIIVITF